MNERGAHQPVPAWESVLLPFVVPLEVCCTSLGSEIRQEVLPYKTRRRDRPPQP